MAINMSLESNMWLNLPSLLPGALLQSGGEFGTCLEETDL